MLATFLIFAHLVSNFASADVTCITGPTTKDNTQMVCGENKVTTYTAKSQKVNSITLLFEEKSRGIELPVTVKNPGLTFAQVVKGDLTTSAGVKKEIEKVKKSWKVSAPNFSVAQYSFDDKAPLFAAADMKSKINTAKLVNKAHRAIASEGVPSAGGVGRSISGGK